MFIKLVQIPGLCYRIRNWPLVKFILKNLFGFFWLGCYHIRGRKFRGYLRQFADNVLIIDIGKELFQLLQVPLPGMSVRYQVVTFNFIFGQHPVRYSHVDKFILLTREPKSLVPTLPRDNSIVLIDYWYLHQIKRPNTLDKFTLLIFIYLPGIKVEWNKFSHPTLLCYPI